MCIYLRTPSRFNRMLLPREVSSSDHNLLRVCSKLMIAVSSIIYTSPTDWLSNGATIQNRNDRRRGGGEHVIFGRLHVVQKNTSSSIALCCSTASLFRHLPNFLPPIIHLDILPLLSHRATLYQRHARTWQPRTLQLKMATRLSPHSRDASALTSHPSRTFSQRRINPSRNSGADKRLASQRPRWKKNYRQRSA